MSWFSQYVGDPLKALLAKVVATGDADLKALAGQVAAQLPASPISATAETTFATGLQVALDGVITSVVGDIPAVGVSLAPTAVAEANAAIEYAVTKGGALLNTLAADAKATLASLASPAEAMTGGAAAS